MFSVGSRTHIREIILPMQQNYSHNTYSKAHFPCSISQLKLIIYPEMLRRSAKMRVVTSLSLMPFITEVCRDFLGTISFSFSPITDSRKEKMVSWLDGPDPSMTHNRLQDEHQEGCIVIRLVIFLKSPRLKETSMSFQRGHYTINITLRDWAQRLRIDRILVRIA